MLEASVELFTGTPERARLFDATASHLFEYTMFALQDAAVLRIARMNDPPRAGPHENISLAALVARLSPLVEAPMAEKFEALSARARLAAEPVMIRRHKVTAHRDARLLLGEEPTVPGVKRAEVESALAMIRELLNAIEGHFVPGSSTLYEQPMTWGDAQSLVYHLKQSLKAGDDEDERLHGGPRRYRDIYEVGHE